MRRFLCTVLLLLSGFVGSAHAAASYQTWTVNYTTCCNEDGDEYDIIENGKPIVRYIVRIWDFPVSGTIFAACVRGDAVYIRYIEQVGETLYRGVQYYGQDEEVGTYLLESAVIGGHVNEECIQNFINAHLGPADPQPTPPATPPNKLPGGDFDGDGTTNANDLDDDNDGTPDTTDASPFNPMLPPGGTTPASDFDGDTIPNSSDTDDDNDGVPDVNDPGPYNPTVPSGGGPNPPGPQPPGPQPPGEPQPPGPPGPGDPNPEPPGPEGGVIGSDGNPNGTHVWQHQHGSRIHNLLNRARVAYTRFFPTSEGDYVMRFAFDIPGDPQPLALEIHTNPSGDDVISQAVTSVRVFVRSMLKVMLAAALFVRIWRAVRQVF